MNTLSVVKTGGKQYMVKSGDIITVDRMEGEVGSKVQLVKLAEFALDGSTLQLGAPALSETVTAEVVETGKGNKIRVAKFKAKVRFRKVMGFRPHLTKLKIVSV
ncbi:MAG: 50S ribosomal protein L21 [bacterium]